MARIGVEVVYALPAEQRVVQLELEAGATAIEALRASGLLDRHPEIAGAEPLLGIFGARVKPDACLKAGDRVEVYRPLRLDPMAARRAKASRARRSGR
jgi:putative ubiquitin-RnfH superfamily antitoxin RatB of RatAB toxin-antitoxin module